MQARSPCNIHKNTPGEVAKKCCYRLRSPSARRKFVFAGSVICVCITQCVRFIRSVSAAPPSVKVTECIVSGLENQQKIWKKVKKSVVSRRAKELAVHENPPQGVGLPAGRTSSVANLRQEEPTASRPRRSRSCSQASATAVPPGGSVEAVCHLPSSRVCSQAKPRTPSVGTPRKLIRAFTMSNIVAQRVMQR